MGLLPDYLNFKRRNPYNRKRSARPMPGLTVDPYRGLVPDPLASTGGTDPDIGPMVPDSKKRIGRFGLDPVTGLTDAARKIRARSIAVSAKKRRTLLGGLDEQPRTLKNYYNP